MFECLKFNLIFGIAVICGCWSIQSPTPTLIREHRIYKRATDTTQCSSTKFRCENGECINKSYLCDGLNDCNDGEDEASDLCRKHICSSSKFHCKSGHCLDKSLLCNGWYNCKDGDDEASDLCKDHSCSRTKFHCKSGHCIDKNLLCNGWNNCKDEDDEATDLCKNHSCSSTKFHCKSGHCIDKSLLCNGYNNCIDGDDEASELCKDNRCSGTKFHCKSGHCLDQSLLCNGYNNCDDRDDEDSDLCKDNSCSSTKFHCKSGHCLDQSLLCNGYKNCDDGEDEASELCKDNTCRSSKFHCKTGICIDKSMLCDGRNNCKDNEDEETELCEDHVSTTSIPNSTTRASSSTSRAPSSKTKAPSPTTRAPNSMTSTPSSKTSASSSKTSVSSSKTSTPSSTNASSKTQCILPPATPDKTYVTHCPSKDQICGMQPGERVPEFTPIISQCAPGYAKYQDGQVRRETGFVSTCLKGSWMPEVVRCKKICKALPSPGLDFTCSQSPKATRQPCPKILVEGNVVFPRCKQHYHPDRGLDYRDRYVVCQNDGGWDREFFTCSADCGKANSSSINLIYGGEREKPGGAPWNVAIYSTVNTKTPNFICGGTLISVQIVLSAAHCFYDSNLHKIHDESSYFVTFGQYSRDLETKESNLVKKYKIKKIYVPDEYIGSQTNFAADLAVLRLADKIPLSEQILPACVYWSDFTPFKPPGETYGKLSGFGTTENGTLSSRLLTASLPYVSYGNCLKKLEWDLKDSISHDKFCAGNTNGSGARTGDSGGGLMFLNEKQRLYYLRGVVSHQVESLTSIAAFTDIAQHLSWITAVVQDVNDSELKDETGLNFKSKK